MNSKSDLPQSLTQQQTIQFNDLMCHHYSKSKLKMEKKNQNVFEVTMTIRDKTNYRKVPQSY
jgi:hypothetical protein